MPTRVLQIRSSATGSYSVSNLLADAVIDKLAERKLEMVIRDIDCEPIPHVTSGNLSGVMRQPPASSDARRTRTLSDELIGELNWADLLVICAPMYNFGIPTTLKAWFDHVIRAGATFDFIENSPVGLLQGKRAIICSTRGNVYLDTHMASLDCQEPHIFAMLSWIGIKDITFLRAEGLASGGNVRAIAINEALKAIDQIKF